MKTIFTLAALLLSLSTFTAHANTPDEVTDAFAMQQAKYPSQIGETYEWYLVDIDNDGRDDVLLDTNHNDIYQIWHPEGIGRATFGGVTNKTAIEFLVSNGSIMYATGEAINPQSPSEMN